jgi:2,3-bisphosphoglycerate-independent phosphoglycerate mutase
LKHIVLVPDGMADYPLRELSWATPLAAARAPNIKSLGRAGEMGLFRSLPRGAQAGSDVANMAIMGYDPVTQLTGRGAIEAAAMDISLGETEIAFRCNLVARNGGNLADYSAGYIGSDEGAQLIEAIGEELGSEAVSFHPGKSFRNILVLKGEEYSDEVLTTPPHDIVGQGYSSYLPSAREPGARKTEEKLRDLIARSKKILDDHPINGVRKREGLSPGNMIWPWGPGRRMEIRPFKEIWGVSGAAVSAVDSVKGLARSAGMEAPDVQGATGFLDTDYEAKAQAALEALRRCDLVYLHVEAMDEMGHAGNVKGKIKGIEDFDARLVSPLISGLESSGRDYRIAVIPDHYTPCTVRTHVRDPTPFAIARAGEKVDQGPQYNEENAKLGSLGTLWQDQFIRQLIMP